MSDYVVIDEIRDSPAYWIEIAKRAYADGIDEALPAIAALIDLEAAGRRRIPSCQWGTPKPYDLQDVSRAVYDYWIQRSFRPNR